MGENIMGDPITQAIIFVISTAYQVDQAKKLKKKQQAAAEARKGSQFSVNSEAINLPLVYGRQLVAGVQFDHKVSPNFIAGTPESDTNIFLSNLTAPYRISGSTLLKMSGFSHVGGGNVANSSSMLGSSVTGTKNEFMFIKHALCYSGINAIKHVMVNSKPFNSREFKKGQRIVVHPNGGTDNMLQNNGYPSLDKFTNVCYASEVFRLDREENNYSGAPSTQYLIEGMKVHSVDRTSDGGGYAYSISQSKSYSNNPAYVLLDYLTNTIYGKGLPTSQVDLASFYDAAVICGTEVLSNKVIAGHVHGNKPLTTYPTFSQFPDPNTWGFEDVYAKATDTGQFYAWNKTGGDDKNPTGSWSTITAPKRDIPLYECNMTIDTERPMRDNIEDIMSSMNMAELTWDSQGRYKLSLEYPSSYSDLQGLVTQSFNKDNIIRDSFNVTFPTALDRYNQVTVSFLNEHEDFKTDTVSWPEKGTTVYNSYFSEDNSQTFETTISPPHITDPYHALAQAEQMVRTSRSIYTISFVTNRDGLSVEPGDFVDVELEEGGFGTPKIIRVTDVKIREDFTVEITGYYFDEQALSWNIADDVAYPVNNNTYNFTTDNVESLSLNQNQVSEYKVGLLEWDYPQDEGNGNFTYEILYKKNTDADFEPLGRTNTTSFEFANLKDFLTHSVYDFKVIVRTPLGLRSTGTIISNITVDKTPGPVTSLNVVEELYVTNNASGVKSRAILTWTPDTSGLHAGFFLVEYKKQSESVFTTLGTVATEHITVPDVSHSPYDFKITPYSDFHFAGPPTTFQKIIVGLSAAPSDPTNFAGNINEGQINLSWGLSTDLDVIYGGSCEIRFHNETTATASWETASVLVDSLSGNTNNKTVPTLRGTFFIKFKDSRGIYSDGAATFVSQFFDDSFNQIDLVNEHTSWLGNKTNCTQVNGYLELDVGQTLMSYNFSNILDLGEVISVRVSPQLLTSVTLRGVDVEDYADVSLEQSFAGPLQNAALRVEVATTQDDPNGASPTWTSYELLTIGSFTCRGLKFRFLGEAENTNTRIIVEELGILVDKKDVIKTGASTSSTSGDTQVTFTVPFYAGIGGGSNPTIGYGIIGGQSNDAVVITSRNKDGFYYSVFNNNSRVQRTIDWQAIGQ
jgi:hypothetical protein